MICRVVRATNKDTHGERRSRAEGRGKEDGKKKRKKKRKRSFSFHELLLFPRSAPNSINSREGEEGRGDGLLTGTVIRRCVWIHNAYLVAQRDVEPCRSLDSILDGNVSNARSDGSDPVKGCENVRSVRNDPSRLPCLAINRLNDSFG